MPDNQGASRRRRSVFENFLDRFEVAADFVQDAGKRRVSIRIICGLAACPDAAACCPRCGGVDRSFRTTKVCSRRTGGSEGEPFPDRRTFRRERRNSDRLSRADDSEVHIRHTALRRTFRRKRLRPESDVRYSEGDPFVSRNASPETCAVSSTGAPLLRRHCLQWQ
jgi:hypothetical protein